MESIPTEPSTVAQQDCAARTPCRRLRGGAIAPRTCRRPRPGSWSSASGIDTLLRACTQRRVRCPPSSNTWFVGGPQLAVRRVVLSGPSTALQRVKQSSSSPAAAPLAVQRRGCGAHTGGYLRPLQRPTRPVAEWNWGKQDGGCFQASNCTAESDDGTTCPLGRASDERPRGGGSLGIGDGFITAAAAAAAARRPCLCNSSSSLTSPSTTTTSPPHPHKQTSGSQHARHQL
jgi:hypothetical protein